MKNNNLITVLLTALSIVTMSCNNNVGNKRSETKKPNILFILVDDLGYTDLSCQGSKYYETPNVDKIAKEGMTFTNGYAACQVCSPSRASILTGMFAPRHGITDWIGAPSGEAWRKTGRHTKLLPADYVHNLKKDLITLPEVLKSAGYKTFFAGKWHLGGKGSWPQDHGFDINIGGWHAGSPNGGYFSPWKNPNLPNKTPGENLSMRLAKETIKFLDENKDTTFLAYLSFYAVHAPIQTTENRWRKYRDKADSMGIADKGFTMERRLPYRLHQDNPVYAGLIEQMDNAVGVVLNELDKLGLDKNTIVVFTGDNGGVVSGDNYSTNLAPLRGGKGYQWEGGIREPFFVKVPWMDIAGKKCDVPVASVDFFPTLLELAHIPLPSKDVIDGKSIVPLLKGGNIPERDLIWHYPHYGNQGGDPSSIIRRGKWKLIHYYETDKDELYNLSVDISEKNNVAGEHPNIVKDLHKRLFTYLKSVNAKYPVKDPEYDAKAEAKYMEYIRTKKMQHLEDQRKQMLSPDFNPGNNWWGSIVTKD